MKILWKLFPYSAWFLFSFLCACMRQKRKSYCRESLSPLHVKLQTDKIKEWIRLISAWIRWRRLLTGRKNNLKPCLMSLALAPLFQMGSQCWESISPDGRGSDFKSVLDLVGRLGQTTGPEMCMERLHVKGFYDFHCSISALLCPLCKVDFKIHLEFE